MLPTAWEDDLTADFELAEQPTRTYRLHFGGKPSVGKLDGLEAMKQAIYLILNCERYRYEMFSWNYGSEIDALIGQQNDATLQLRLKSVISEALLADDRILSVTNFSFQRNESSLLVTFTAQTTQGEVESALRWWGSDWEVTLWDTAMR